MLEAVGKYLAVYLGSMVKFIAGPLTGLATGLSYWESVVFTVLGMMTTVLVLTLVGPGLRNWLKNRFGSNKRRLFTRRSRIFVRIWKRWGIFGVSFLTPLLLTPIGGALLANAFCGDRRKILLSMLVSAVFWGFVYNGALYGGLYVVLQNHKLV